MKKELAAPALLFSAAILALSGCSKSSPQEPAPKTAAPTEMRSSSMAIEYLQETIDWTASAVAQSRAALFKDLLDSGAAISDGTGSYGRRSRDFEWLAVIDPTPGAYFRHPVRYSFVRYSPPALESIERERLPLRDGVPLWSSAAAYVNDPNIIHSGSWLDRPLPPRDPEALAEELQNWPPRMATDHCPNQRRAYAILVHNLPDLESSQETKDNLEQMAAALAANGYAVVEFLDHSATGETRPYVNLAAPRGDGIYKLRNFVSIHQDFNDCCEEMLLYITGETGVETVKGRSDAFFELPFSLPRSGGGREASPRLYADDLAQILAELKTCHVNVVIDTNNAALFADDLLRVPQVESVTASCHAGEYTYSSGVDALVKGAFLDPYGTKDGERGSEFTSSFAKGLFDQAESLAANALPIPAHQLALRGFEATRLYDLAYLGGQSTPIMIGRTISSNCPCGVDAAPKRL